MMELIHDIDFMQDVLPLYARSDLYDLGRPCLAGRPFNGPVHGAVRSSAQLLADDVL